MSELGDIGTIVAGALAVMMTVVSWRVLKDHSTLSNPVISVCVGVLTFIGLRYRPGGLVGMILLSYEAVAISILFLLLYRAFKRLRESSFMVTMRGFFESRKGKSHGKDRAASRRDTRHQPTREGRSHVNTTLQ